MKRQNYDQEQDYTEDRKPREQKSSAEEPREFPRICTIDLRFCDGQCRERQGDKWCNSLVPNIDFKNSYYDGRGRVTVKKRD